MKSKLPRDNKQRNKPYSQKVSFPSGTKNKNNKIAKYSVKYGDLSIHAEGHQSLKSIRSSVLKDTILLFSELEKARILAEDYALDNDDEDDELEEKKLKKKLKLRHSKKYKDPMFN